MDQFYKKIYLFYLHAQNISSELYPGIGQCPTVFPVGDEICTFYAWTSKKSLRDLFRQTRNMKLFQEEKKEFDDRKQFEQFSDLYNNQILENRAITTKAIQNHQIVLGVTFVLSTSVEVDHVVFDEHLIMNKLFFSKEGKDGRRTSSLLPKGSFNEQYQELLDVLDFYNVTYPMDELPFKPYTFKVDSLALFVHEFINTYRKGGFTCESISSIGNQNIPMTK